MMHLCCSRNVYSERCFSTGPEYWWHDLQFPVLDFVWGIHWWPVNPPHKGPVTRKMFSFHDVIMQGLNIPGNSNFWQDLRAIYIDWNKKDSSWMHVSTNKLDEWEIGCSIVFTICEISLHFTPVVGFIQGALKKETLFSSLEPCMSLFNSLKCFTTFLNKFASSI